MRSGVRVPRRIGMVAVLFVACTSRPLPFEGARDDLAPAATDASLVFDLQPADASLVADLSVASDLRSSIDAAVVAADMTLPRDASAPADLGMPSIPSCSATATPLPSTIATSFRTDPAHTGEQSTDPIAPPLCLAWYVDLGTSISYPIVVGGFVFVSTGTVVFALDAATGELGWGPVSITSPSLLAYDQGRLFALAQNGALVALDASDGTSLWSTNLTGQLFFWSPPVAAGGQIFVNGLESGGTTYAVDETSGAVEWTAYTGAGSEGAPAVDGSVVFEAEACQTAYAFDAATGARLWVHAPSCDGGGGAAPAVLGGKLYERDWALGPVILDTSDGSAIGSFDANEPPVLDGNTGFFPSSYTLAAVDLGSSTTLWTFTSPDGGGGLASPVTSQGVVFTASSSGILYALDKLSGNVMWSAQLDREVTAYGETSSMVIASGTLFVPAGNRMYALRSAN